MNGRYCDGGVKVLLLSSALLLCSACNRPEDAQTAPDDVAGRTAAQQADSAEAKAPGQTLSAIESLVAPIALYPDPLLAELLVAATYPPEIALAARRLEVNAGADAANDSSLDASIVRLARLPPVIIMMNEHPQWTAALGDAFLAQPEELLKMIQTLRQRALHTGFLKDAAAQKVLKKTVAGDSAAAHESAAVLEKATSARTESREAIYIQPAGAEKISVPLYDPETVFSASLASQAVAAGNTATAQQPVPADANEAVRGDYYPAYYPLPAEPGEAGESGRTPMAYGAGATVDGLLTWGIIEWSGADGNYIMHRYGKLTNCHDTEDCWMRSGDNGYRYWDGSSDKSDSGIAESGEDAPLTVSSTTLGRPWHHDPRHRRGLRYSEDAGKRLGEIRPPPLAGQRLSAMTPALQVRGFDIPQSVPPGDTETENGAGVAFLSRGVARSVFSGIDDPKATIDEEIKRGGLSRNRNKNAMQRPASVHVPSGQRTAKKPGLNAAQLETLRELQMQQRRREAALPSAFDFAGDTARRAGLAGLRGAESRGQKVLSELRKAAQAHPSRAQPDAD
jgi:hypothetical protein